MPCVAQPPPVHYSHHSKVRFSLAEFELHPLQDPRDAWELAFPNSTSCDQSILSTSESESRNLIDKSTDDGIHFPEGGRRAWLAVFGSWSGLFASLGLMNTVGAFQEYISTHQLRGVDVAITGWIFSLYAFMTFGVGLFVGPLFDKYGPRWLILSGSVLVILSMDLIGNCTEFWHFIICFSLFGGIGSALLFSPSVAIIGHYFSRRRGYATGIATTGGAFGGILYPLIIQLLTPSIGFLWSTRLMALISLILCGFANIFMQPFQTPGPTASAWPNLLILRRPAFALTVLGVFLLEFALFVPLTYITSYSKANGYSTSISSAVLPVLNVGSVFGRCLPGYFADKYGRYNIAILAIIFTVLAVFDVWLPGGDTTPGLIVFALLFGLSSGSNISLTPVCIGQLCCVEQYGRYYSTCFSIVSLGCLTGVPIAGMILDADGGNYRGLILFVGSCYAVGLVAFICVRLVATGCKVKRKY